jgi:hypothetical protein
MEDLCVACRLRGEADAAGRRERRDGGGIASLYDIPNP